MNILGIRRSPRFSPNSIDRDAAIFSAVTSQLERKGHNISIISEDLFIAVDLNEFDLVFSMARDNSVLEKLALAEQQGTVVIYNSAIKLLQSTRRSIVDKFQTNGIFQPVSLSFDSYTIQNEDILTKFQFPFWLKRGESCAQEAHDICYINNQEEWNQAILLFKEKGVHELIAVEHIKGDLIKFYGVEGTDFFFYLYPTDGSGFSKFGLERHNGIPNHYAFDAQALERMTDQAAAITGFTIYGGDVIVKPDGSFYIIDFNDWPSFSSCRKQAAKAIAQRICNNH